MTVVRRPTSFAIAVLATVALVAPPASAIYAIRGSVIGNGANPSVGITGSGRVLFGTAGQAAVGMSFGTNYELCHGFWCFGGSRVVSVDPLPPGEGPRIPTELSLGIPFPNPASAAATVLLALPRESRVDLAILDVQGRMVRRVMSGPLPAGWQHLGWDGLDESGRRAGAGVYLVRLLVDGRLAGTRRVVLRP